MIFNISEKLQAYYKKVGDLIKEARKQKNMNVRVLADLVDVHPKYIENLEKGCPGYQKAYYLERIARALDVDIESITPED